MCMVYDEKLFQTKELFKTLNSKLLLKIIGRDTREVGSVCKNAC